MLPLRNQPVAVTFSARKYTAHTLSTDYIQLQYTGLCYTAHCNNNNKNQSAYAGFEWQSDACAAVFVGNRLNHFTRSPTNGKRWNRLFSNKRLFCTDGSPTLRLAGLLCVRQDSVTRGTINGSLRLAYDFSLRRTPSCCQPIARQSSQHIIYIRNDCAKTW